MEGRNSQPNHHDYVAPGGLGSMATPGYHSGAVVGQNFSYQPGYRVPHWGFNHPWNSPWPLVAYNQPIYFPGMPFHPNSAPPYQNYPTNAAQGTISTGPSPSVTPYPQEWTTDAVEVSISTGPGQIDGPCVGSEGQEADIAAPPDIPKNDESLSNSDDATSQVSQINEGTNRRDVSADRAESPTDTGDSVPNSEITNMSPPAHLEDHLKLPELDFSRRSRHANKSLVEVFQSADSDSMDDGYPGDESVDGSERSSTPGCVALNEAEDVDPVRYSTIEVASTMSESAKKWQGIMRNNPGLTRATVDHIVTTFGHEEFKSHCVAIFDHLKLQMNPKHCKTNAIFGGNRGLGLDRLANLYVTLLGELGGGDLRQEEIHSRCDAERILAATCEEPCIVQIKDFSLSDEALEALKMLFDKSLPRVSVVASKTWSSAFEENAFNMSFPQGRQTENVFVLRDYTREQLQHILNAAAKRSNKTFEHGIESNHFKKMTDILTHGTGTPGFTNHITVQRGLKAMIHIQKRRHKRRSSRLNRRLDTLLKADMLGETAEELKREIPAWHEMSAMVGLHQVKEAIGIYFSQVQYQHCRVLQSRPTSKLFLNRLFLGPPGTGKTTTARLLARILIDLGLVRRNKIVSAEPTTLIANYVGHSEANVRKAFDKARGGILIIDDAHTFFSGGKVKNLRSSSDSFRTAILDALVSLYQQHEADDPDKRVTVFFIGHKDEVVELFETSNAGLGQMLPLNEALHFPTYSDEHLREILRQGLDTAGLSASLEAVQTAHEFLSLARHRPDFGNGTSVNSLISKAISRYQARVLSTMDIYSAIGEPLQPQDFDPDFDRHRLAAQRATELFSELGGIEYVPNIFRGYQELVVQLRSRNIDPRPYVPLSFVFKGPPGTGKTTVARKVAKMYYDMGFLSAPDMIECSVSQLISTVRDNSTGIGVMFERALGKVLFIDEAYLLRYTGGSGAIGDLVDCMTKDRFIGKLVVVLAGYTEDMDKLLEENRGLRSRFPTSVFFRPMRSTDAIELLKSLVRKAGLEICGLNSGDKWRLRAVKLFTELAATRSWANGRDIEGLARALVQNRYRSHKDKGQDGRNSATKDDRMKIEAIDVVILLASRLGEALEADKKKTASKEHVRDPSGRTGARYATH